MSDVNALDIGKLLEEQKEFRICQVLVDVFRLYTGSDIRPVRPSGVRFFMAKLLAGGFKRTFSIKIYCVNGVSASFTEKVKEVKQRHIDSNISIPETGVFVDDQKIMDEIRWSLDDGAHRAAACRELYLQHEKDYPEKQEERDLKYKYVTAVVYHEDIQKKGKRIYYVHISR